MDEINFTLYIAEEVILNMKTVLKKLCKMKENKEFKKQRISRLCGNLKCLIYMGRSSENEEMKLNN